MGTKQNKPRRFFSLLLPASITALLLILEISFNIKFGIFNYTTSGLIALLLGYSIDERQKRRGISRVNAEQNRQLYKSLLKLEDRYDELREAKELINSSLKEKDVLLREIYHRTGSNMHVVSSLLNIQSRFIKEPKYIDMFKDSRNRIRSMALVHEKLYLSSDLEHIDFKEYISSLTEHLCESYSKISKKISVSKDVDDIVLNIDAAVPCGLLINELLSNSLIHAFPGGMNGQIKISFKKREIDGDTLKELTVSDNGVGIPEGFDIRKSKSLGFQLIISLAEQQLRGELNLDRHNGTEFVIRFKESFNHKEDVTV